MTEVLTDLRLAGRAYSRQPGFTLVAILVLALGIGANTAIYTLVDAVTLRPLPVTNPGELYRLGDTNNCCVSSGLQGSFSLYAHPLYRHLSEHAPEFVSIAGFQANLTPISVRRASGGAAEPGLSELVSGNYFTTLGVRMAAGRALTLEDDRAGAAPVAVMSYRLWRDRFGLDPAVVGEVVMVNARPLTIVGVTEPRFFGDTLRTDPADLWIPFNAVLSVIPGASSMLASTGQHWVYAIGRLRPGAHPDAVGQRLTAALQQWLAEQSELSTEARAELPRQHIVLTPGGGGVSRVRVRYTSGLAVLAIVSALVLLLACANLANVILARTQPFQFALRAALGASRARLVRQTLAGGLLLALAGGACGLVVAYLATRAILAMLFSGARHIPIDATPSPAVLGFAVLVSLLTGALFSVVPALVLSRTNPIEALRGAGRSTGDRGAFSRQGLVILQVAVSLVLLVGAGLLTTSLQRIEHQEFGFETDGRLVVRVSPLQAGYAPEGLAVLYDQLQQRLSRLPDLLSVSLSQYSPMGNDNWSSGISVEGRTANAARPDSASWLRISPRYFETIGTRLVRGRAIDERDTPTAPRVAMVNEAFAKRFFPSSDPIGRHFGFGGVSHTYDFEIVGVSADAKYIVADEPAWPTFFLPLLQTVAHEEESTRSAQARSLFVRDIELHVSGHPASLETDVRRTLAAIDPNLTVLTIVELREQLARTFNQRRLVARLTALYGQLALLLAAVGLYGVTAHHVARRSAEIGIRMALGANRRMVLMMVLRRALLQAGAGLAVGVPIALVAGSGLSAQLYGVGSHDPLVLVTAVIVLTLSTLLAALVPARRAASIDPITALRSE